MNRKANAGIIAIIIIVLIIILILYIVELAQHECDKNSECPENNYCGADDKCHEYPNQIVVKQATNVPAAIIIAAGLVAAALLFKGVKLRFWKKAD